MGCQGTGVGCWNGAGSRGATCQEAESVAKDDGSDRRDRALLEMEKLEMDGEGGSRVATP